MTVSGFTIVRNARKLDYPFEPSVRSALPLCDEFWIGCGDSDDDTRAICAKLAAEFPDKVHVFDSIWPTENQSGGRQLREQTNAALAKCRGEWCFYLQADEAVHEADLPALKVAMGRASAHADVDGLVFDYLHFYGSYAYTITGRNWYRREVRLFKNGRGIEAFRDAQGFRRANGERLRALPSGARIFHYGYVRDARSLGTKSQEMSRWWGEKPKTDAKSVQWVRHVGLRPFRGEHPSAMHARIRSAVLDFEPSRCRRKWDRQEFKNALTLVWDRFFSFRLGEFRNYELVKTRA